MESFKELVELAASILMSEDKPLEIHPEPINRLDKGMRVFSSRDSFGFLINIGRNEIFDVPPDHPVNFCFLFDGGLLHGKVVN